MGVCSACVLEERWGVKHLWLPTTVQIQIVGKDENRFGSQGHDLLVRRRRQTDAQPSEPPPNRAAVK